MKMSKLMAPTLRQTPAEAEVVSHQLLLRAGYIRRSSAGVYHYLPLAHRVLQKITQIIREEMNKADGQEIVMPVMQPAELWAESGRWHVYGDELFRLKDRHNRDFCLGPTHEEIVTDLVRNDIRSYRQLPLLLYQIANKYRDERRPRFGLLRGREFIMKDLYSFDRDEEALDRTYQSMYHAYSNIFKRCGLTFRPVEADAGAIGGTGGTHEFMVIADSGEGAILFCHQCDYAANVEKAESALTETVSPQEPLDMLTVDTPEQRTIEEVSNYLNISPSEMIKTMIYRADEEVIVVLIRGDHQLNEVKLANLTQALDLELASEEECQQISPGGQGFLGPQGLGALKIYADKEVMKMTRAVAGANERNKHVVNLCPGRDFQVTIEADLRMVEAGEACPKCRAPLEEARGIEVGQVFKLGTKYSTALGCTFLDEKGKEKPMVMGCYGIGVSRTMAATVEQNHDEVGIIWPMSIAPYQVIVVPLSYKDEQQREIAEKFYQNLLQQGIEALIDDRDERPGVKFKDADLIGIPIRVVIGSKAIKEGLVEVKVRKTGEQHNITVEEATNKVMALIEQGFKNT
ncbi:proline--tRNA ligase [Heliorestis acidaminivorans]|uniref:Proline--tRNA ligase n=1 Tax=Heliorestis acidaminivorans TaxID=553427 RepID=A0A6I0F2Z8_9FIRM|nr:proline--tRNA ligase [Heliorestis acidaminivorans]KAB2954361.1 proline--tRNA ligase [Heliorestis acidaminivorans]